MGHIYSQTIADDTSGPDSCSSRGYAAYQDQQTRHSWPTATICAFKHLQACNQRGRYGAALHMKA